MRHDFGIQQSGRREVPIEKLDVNSREEDNHEGFHRRRQEHG